MRIGMAALSHETNTFAPTKAGLQAFRTGGAFPPLSTGPDLLARVKGKNLPIAGFVDRIEALDHRVHPLTWAAASPSNVMIGSGAMRHNICNWFSVIAVPNGATAAPNPACTKAMTSIYPTATTKGLPCPAAARASFTL